MERFTTSDDLTGLERDVLEALAESRVTRSAVALAIGLYDRGGISGLDPSGLICWVIEGLGKYGLVNYTVGDRDIPVDIRLTNDGWHAIGYTVQFTEVGHRRGGKDTVRRIDDATDFRNFYPFAIGGPIERMSLLEHVLVYPEHPHSNQLEELGMPTANPSAYVRNVTPGGSWERSRNQKRLILSAIVEMGGKISGELGSPAINPLHNHLRDSDKEGYLNPHNLAHMLFTLRKDALLKLRVRSKGNSQQDIVFIEITQRGRDYLNGLTGARLVKRDEVGRLPKAKSNGKHPVGVDRTDPRTHRQIAEGGPITRERIIEAGKAAVEAVKSLPPDLAFSTLPRHQNEKPQVAEVIPQVVEEAPAVFTPAIALTASSSTNLIIDDEAREEAIKSFPLIVGLANRGKQIEQAAALLEQAGQTDLALAALDSIRYTDFEKEVLRLWFSIVNHAGS